MSNSASAIKDNKDVSMVKMYPLTHAEKRIYLTQKLNPESSMWNIPTSYRIPDGDAAVMEKAVSLSMGCQPGLGVRFTEKDGVPFKYFAQNHDINIDRFDFSDKSDPFCLEFLEAKSAVPIEMLDSPLHYFAVLKGPGNAVYLYTLYHHIAMDGRSNSVAAAHIFRAYEELMKGNDKYRPDIFPSDPMPAIENENQYFTSEKYNADKTYWNNRFEAIPEPMESGLKVPKGELAVLKHVSRFDRQTAEKIAAFCNKEKVSPFRIFVSALGIYFSRIFNRDDAVFGSATGNRHPGTMQNAMAMFVSSVLLKLDIPKEASFKDILSQTRTAVKEALVHERYPYDQLVSDLRATHGDAPKLSSVSVVEFLRPDIPDDCELYIHSYGESENSLTIYFSYPKADEKREIPLETVFIYRKDCFEPWQIERMSRHIENLINNALDHPVSKAGDISFLSEKEKTGIIQGFNPRDPVSGSDSTVHDIISRQCRRNPGASAVVWRDRILTYGELGRLSDILAKKLHDMGVGPGTVAGLLMDRCPEIIIAQTAILKAGAAFMPIDAEYPDERISFMLGDVNAPCLVTARRFIKERDFTGTTLVDMDDPDIFKGEESSFKSFAKPEDPCVVIYTSGSTGKPKGVILKHQGLSNIILGAIEEYRITSEDKIAKHASFSFDASLLEVFTALFSGAALHLVPEEIKLSLGPLNEFYEKYKITFGFLTTQLGEQFMEYMDNTSLKTLVVGGEKLRTFTKRSYKLFNIYGPTECSIFVTGERVETYEENIPIGRPMPGCRVYVLDKHNNPQPPGAPGELCIAGPCVAIGYHNRPEKTKACFVPDPFYKKDTMYRTGDLAAFMPDGKLLHLGRMDRQVKLRGFRIELGEIENAMLEFQGVSQAAVADFRDNRGRVYLCGYFVSENTVPEEGFKTFLKKRIPEFMVPLHMVQMDRLPIMPSGKIDRLKLPEPEKIIDPKQDYIEPQNGLEKDLAKIWSELLNLEKISADADFFRCGGDSLRAVALQVKIRKTLEYEISLSDIFSNPSPQKMAELLEASGKDNRNPMIEKAPELPHYPASVAQQQLFLLSRMQGIKTSYNMPLRIDIQGDLDRKALSGAVRNLLKRHVSLRTRFDIIDGTCVQIPRDNPPLKMEFSEVAPGGLEPVIHHFVKPFDLSKAPLFRVKLLALQNTGTPQDHVLLMDMHHIVSDGVSVGIIVRDLFDLYQGKAPKPLVFQHRDFTYREAQRQEEVKKNQERFWIENFSNPPETGLPTDRPRKPGTDFEGDEHLEVLSFELSEKLRKLAKNQEATLHQVMLAALSILIARWSDTEDVIIGTSTSGRDLSEAEAVVGMFVRTLPTRHRPDNGKPFAALLNETRQHMRAIYANSEYPISALYEKLGLNRGPGRHPLFDVNFVMQETGMTDLIEAGNIRATTRFISTGTAKFDISLGASVKNGCVNLRADYRKALYSGETMARFMSHFTRILESVSENIEIAVGDIDILCAEEKETLLNRFNPRPVPMPDWPTVCHAVSLSVKKHPDKTAIVSGTRTITYRELEEISNRAANVLLKQKKSGDAVAVVAADRSVHAVVSMIAVLKAGCAYVAVDPSYPDERKSFIIEDTKAFAVVGSSEGLDSFDPDLVKISVDSEICESDKNPEVLNGGNELAYLIFTSGSTGTPKGVAIEHHSMVNFIHWYRTHHKIDQHSNTAAFASFSFDVSVVQIFAPLTSGGTLHIIPENLRLSPKELDAYFMRENISHAHFPTQFAEQFMRMAEGRSLKTMVVGGDRLTRYRLGPYRLTNEYGPSETTMACLSHDLSEVMDNPPVGSPVDNYRVYILDKKGRLCPIGMPGEICVAGQGVARGYHNRPELTRNAFVQDPFFKGERMYRTGDRGRWLNSGVVEFMERLDFQVKIRGFRIEPGEISRRLSQMGKVVESVVVPIEETPGNKVLAAYYTCESEVPKKEILSHLRSVLPEYMIPTHLIALEKMPLNVNGKIDRSKLPKPELVSPSAAGPIQAGSEKEACIIKCWKEVLGHTNFSAFDSFFEIGGDSLRAISLLAGLSDFFDITASDIFSHTTIADQAANFKEAGGSRANRLMHLKKMAEPLQEDPLYKEELTAYSNLVKAAETLDPGVVKWPEHMLLTGATGTLGTDLLKVLLTETDASVTALVRGKTQKDAEKRLSDVFRLRFNRELSAIAGSRLEVLPADLAKKHFGMETDLYETLTEKIDAVLNSAALTRHYGTWEEFEQANIQSVKRMVAFAKTGRKKTLHHVSTTSIGAGAIDGRTKVLFTESDLDKDQHTDNFYVRSKFISEKLLFEERKTGLDVSIYRAGNITCDSKTGALQKNVEDNAFFQQLRAYVNLGAGPEIMDARNMTFVDQAAQAIVLLIGRPGLVNSVFHIQNPVLLKLSKALEDPQLGLRFDAKQFDDFISHIAAHAGHPGFSEYIERLLMHSGWQDWLQKPEQTITDIRADKTAKTLGRLGFTWKTPDASDLILFVRKALSDRIRRLKDLPCFAGFDDDRLLALAGKVLPGHFDSEDHLQTEGREIKDLHFVMDGIVETYRHNRNGWIGTVRVSGKGACTGEEVLGLNTKTQAGSTVEAVDPVFAYTVPAQDMKKIVFNDPEFAFALLGIIAAKADQAERLFVAV
jgi:fengycin family lipopeptide synthetase D